MAEYSDEVMMETAVDALKQWQITPRSVAQISRTENVVFRVDTAEGKSYALRIHRAGYHTLDELKSEALWTAALNDKDIGAPLPVLTSSGDLYAEVTIPQTEEVRYVGLIEWFEGQTVEEIIESGEDASVHALWYEKLGALMARMHNQASGWSPPEGFVRHTLDLDGFVGENPFWGRFWEIPELSDDQRVLMTKARDWIEGKLKDYPKGPEDFGMIHADLRAANVMVHEEHLNVIDFDDAGLGWHLYDVAVALFDASLGEDLEKLQSALVKGYRTERSLSDEQVADLPLFLTIRTLATLGWLHDRPEVEYYAFLPMLIEHACAVVEAQTRM